MDAISCVSRYLEEKGSKQPTPKFSNPSNSGLPISALIICLTTKPVAVRLLSTWSRPMKACKKPAPITNSKMKKMADSLIMTFSTTSIVPKNL